ncbi:hypothetical protein F0562_010400 [Nyssa sinensis]|uniref:Uncharacterized protein n=1 Tax=Nyssa sinensis TaxID=561372 RepID=A0A5J5A1L1_9ASTE|nr:hypothetical protein F0562_010400 [Nyssa sinensis]
MWCLTTRQVTPLAPSAVLCASSTRSMRLSNEGPAPTSLAAAIQFIKARQIFDRHGNQTVERITLVLRRLVDRRDSDDSSAGGCGGEGDVVTIAGVFETGQSKSSKPKSKLKRGVRMDVSSCEVALLSKPVSEEDD